MARLGILYPGVNESVLIWWSLSIFGTLKKKFVSSLRSTWFL
jgi:hypothetical protein